MDPIKPGTLVEWSSQSQGTEKGKRGTVLAFVPAGSEIYDAVRSVGLEPKELPVSRMLFDMRPSKNDRYLVAIPRGRGTDYYGPRAGAVAVVSQSEDVPAERARYLAQKVPVEIRHNDENGKWVWAVQVVGTDFWLDAFDTEQEAVEFFRRCILPIRNG